MQQKFIMSETYGLGFGSCNNSIENSSRFIVPLTNDNN